MPSQCTIPDCGHLIFGHGWCELHYTRWRRHGTPLWEPATTTARFWSHVNKHDAVSSPHQPRLTPCWLWTKYTDAGGYGQFSLGHRDPIMAHRFAWEEAGGPIPDSLKVLHVCDVRACVRNDERGIYELNGKTFPRWGHLFLGTKADNNADRSAKGRNPGRTAHKLTVANIPEIRRLYANGQSYGAIASLFAVHYSTIRAIIVGVSWRDI